MQVIANGLAAVRAEFGDESEKSTLSTLSEFSE
jgi:hypothetical protein